MSTQGHNSPVQSSCGKGSSAAAQRWLCHGGGPGTGSAWGAGAGRRSSRSYSFPCTCNAVGVLNIVPGPAQRITVTPLKINLIFPPFRSFFFFSIFSPPFFGSYHSHPIVVSSDSWADSFSPQHTSLSTQSTLREWEPALSKTLISDGNLSSCPVEKPHSVAYSQIGKKEETTLGFMFCIVQASACP